MWGLGIEMPGESHHSYLAEHMLLYVFNFFAKPFYWTTKFIAWTTQKTEA